MSAESKARDAELLGKMAPRHRADKQDGGFRAFDLAEDLALLEEAVAPLSVQPRPAPTRSPLLGQCKDCGDGLYLKKHADGGLCWMCESNRAMRADLLAEAAKPITRDEALAQLRDLAGCKEAEDAHGAADMILLRLLNDQEIAIAWDAVKKWYA